MSVFPSVRGGNFSSPSVRIVVVSTGIHDVTGEELLCPEKATVLGPVKIIPQEYPHIRCCNIDVVLPENISERLINQLLGELTGESSDPVTAYRGRHRWIQTFEPVRLGEYPTDEKKHGQKRKGKLTDGKKHGQKQGNKKESVFFSVRGENFSSPSVGNILQSPRLREEGVYLITGGLGGIGLTLAEYLVKTVRARLVLTGRSAFPVKEKWEHWLTTHAEDDMISRKIRKLQAIETLQSEVLVLSADVADQKQMEEVLAQAEERFGAINGVVHAAGVPGGGMIQRRTREEIESILAPKVRGILILGELFKDIPLDFLVLCSSLTSIFGEFGQVAYCAANAFLDAFAHRRTFENNKFTVSINWDAWQEVGMAVNTEVPPELAKWRTEMLQQAILPEEGIDVFSRILKSTFPQVLVSTYDFLNRIEQNNALETRLSSKVLEKTNLSRSAHPRPELSSAYTAPTNEIEQALADIWRQVLGIERIGIHDNFFDLGGDSLLITQVISRVNKILRVDLPPRSLFEKPTVAVLTEHIETIRWVAQDQQSSINYRQEEGEI